MSVWIRMIFIWGLLALPLANADEAIPRTDNEALVGLISGLEHVTELTGEAGSWTFLYRGFPMAVMTSEKHNRMRVMTSIVGVEELDCRELALISQANFDRALDARYAISQERLWSVYIHPLAELQAAQFASAVEQVFNLGKNFRGSYSSSKLGFGGTPRQVPQEPKPDVAPVAEPPAAE